MCGVRGELSIVFVSVAAVGGGKQPHVVGGGVASTSIVTGRGGSEGFRQENFPLNYQNSC